MPKCKSSFKRRGCRKATPKQLLLIAGHGREANLPGVSFAQVHPLKEETAVERGGKVFPECCGSSPRPSFRRRQNTTDDGGQAFPVRCFGDKRLLSGPRQGVVLRAPVVIRCAPGRLD
jgi:hypothetical protein